MSYTKTGGLGWLVSVICKATLWVTASVIFFILVTNTVLRYTLGSSLQWANELPELMFPWLVMSGVVLASVQGGHIATTFLMDAVTPPMRRLVGTVGWLVVAGMYAALCWSTYGLLDIVGDERSPILQVPGSFTYGCMLGGMAMLGLLALQSSWQVFRGQVNFPQGPGSEGAATAQG